MAISVESMPDIAIQTIGSAAIPRDYTTSRMHTATMFEFTWMEEGSAIAILNSARFELPTFGVTLVRPGDSIDYEYRPSPNSGRIRHTWVFFDVVGDDADRGWPPTRVLPADGYLLPLLAHVVHLGTTRPDGWEPAAARAFQFALESYASPHWESAALGRPPVSDTIVRVLEPLISAWLDGEVLPVRSLTALAAVAGVSPDHLGRVFVDQVGLAPVSTVRLLRLARAAILLRQTGMTVVQIARLTGFVSEFHFSRTFKAVAGVSPTVFRASHSARFRLPDAVARLDALF